MLALSLAAAPLVGAVNVLEEACTSGGASSNKICEDAGVDDGKKIVKNVTGILLFLVGAVSVIMIIFGGFKYVTSNGDSNQIQNAKSTILYSVIGLAFALLAQAIVVFVVDGLGQ